MTENPAMTAHPAFRHGRMLSRKKRVSRPQHSTKGHNKIDALNHSKGEHFLIKVFTFYEPCYIGSYDKVKCARGLMGVMDRYDASDLVVC